jgi:NTP pyrophosphatase (non-canonical NTP hydrolase)
MIGEKRIADLEARLDELTKRFQTPTSAPNMVPLTSQESLILVDIIKELRRAEKIHPRWPRDPFHAATVLGEEVGELLKAILERTYHPPDVNEEDLEEAIMCEATQVAAMAIRFIVNMRIYQYLPAEQVDPSG